MALPPETSTIVRAASILLMAVISLAWYSLVMMMFSSAKMVAIYQNVHRWLDGFAGLVFIGFAIRLLLHLD